MATSTADKRKFNVVCFACHAVWTPPARSPLWWRAKKREDDGYLDALPVSGKECGCVKERVKFDAPYRVFGFDDMCIEFDIPFTSFTDAVREYRDAQRGLCTVFIKGVSPKVEAQLAAL